MATTCARHSYFYRYELPLQRRPKPVLAVRPPWATLCTWARWLARARAGERATCRAVDASHRPQASRRSATPLLRRPWSRSMNRARRKLSPAIDGKYKRRGGRAGEQGRGHTYNRERSLGLALSLRCRSERRPYRSARPPISHHACQLRCRYEHQPDARDRSRRWTCYRRPAAVVCGPGERETRFWLSLVPIGFLSCCCWSLLLRFFSSLSDDDDETDRQRSTRRTTTRGEIEGKARQGKDGGRTRPQPKIISDSHTKDMLLLRQAGRCCSCYNNSRQKAAS
ncbi:hypothetical protein Mp_1g13650 [Marchantia polymorpha subsp. ruderalis]|uniref:Uncharacterized protein n=2 Tax=Marchantia polymorpha TaxID=3197 RepID=A0AAF6APT0_MARPO|nr:hypothetical protein MARPO_0019s0135 [Marchantia polymorpha]BBM98450.1 hypothetical protein Mp_1g13650 [Marchantia polymorpha subsp. ruderalis]|eukprot:PTQ44721.1 hypothetical protein MARPO_0019s0135 [Marchantia polymorpha]